MGTGQKLDEKDVLRFIAEFIVERGYSPTYGNIGEQFRVSRSTAFRYVDTLEMAGKVVIDRGIARSIRIVEDK